MWENKKHFLIKFRQSFLKHNFKKIWSTIESIRNWDSSNFKNLVQSIKSTVSSRHRKDLLTVCLIKCSCAKHANNFPQNNNKIKTTEENAWARIGSEHVQIISKQKQPASLDVRISQVKSKMRRCCLAIRTPVALVAWA